jgi:hypothetical protein
MGRKKDHPHAILSGTGQGHPRIGGCTFEELMRDLKQDTGAVSGARVTALRSPVTQALKNLKPLLNDGMGFLALDIDHKTDATGISLLCRVIKALLRWKPRDAHCSFLITIVDVSATRRRLHQRGSWDG